MDIDGIKVTVTSCQVLPDMRAENRGGRMSDKRDPTRLHEVLGVEPNELFVIKGSEGQFYLNDSGDFRFVRDLDKKITDDVNPYSITEAVNYGITRRPRLTEEQMAQLKALVTLGYGWIVKDLEGLPYACASKPKKERDDWRGGGAFIDLYPFMPTNCLMDLPDWSDPAPLDIVQVLRQNGCEVDDG